MGNEGIQEISPLDARGLKRFAALERELLGGYPLYVSNFDDIVIRQVSGRSAMTRKMQIALFTTRDGERDAARCAALINPVYQADKQEAVGSIGYFAAAPNAHAQVLAMLARAEDWLKARGVTRCIAPFNGSALLGYGLLTAAFDEEPVMAFGWNPPYYAGYFTQAGYRPTYPLLVYTTDFTCPEFRAAVDRAAANRAFTVRPINMRRWRAELDIFRELINEAFVNEWEWYPATLDEFDETFSAMKPRLNPGVMLVAEVGGKAAGVCIGIPNWNPLLREFQGQLGLPQMAQFLLRGGRYPGGGHVFAAVRPEFRGLGMGQILVVSVCRTYERMGLTKAYGYTINVDNRASRRMNEAIGGEGRILYHAYDKRLA